MENQIEKLKALYESEKTKYKKCKVINPYVKGMIVDYKHFSLKSDNGKFIENVHEIKAIVVEIIGYYARVMYFSNDDICLSLVDTRKIIIDREIKQIENKMKLISK